MKTERGRRQGDRSERAGKIRAGGRDQGGPGEGTEAGRVEGPRRAGGGD